MRSTRDPGSGDGSRPRGQSPRPVEPSPRRDPRSPAFRDHTTAESASGRPGEPRAAEQDRRGPEQERFRGGRRERHRGDPNRRTLLDRQVDVAELLGVYRIVTRKQIVQQSFGGNAFAANRVLKKMQSEGYIQSMRSGPGRYPYEVLALTRVGADWIGRERDKRRKKRRRSARASDREQLMQHGFGDSRQLMHDQRVFEAVAEDTGRAVGKGASVRRVRLDSELKGILASASESARQRGGRVAADNARAAAARRLGLRVPATGTIPLPDALVELEHGDGRTEVRAIEVGTSAYTGKQIAQKREAGFRFYLPRISGGGGGGGSRNKAPEHSGVAFPLDWGVGGGGR